MMDPQALEAFAQSPMAVVLSLAIGLGLYLFMAIAQYVIGRKTGAGLDWMAFIPFLNIYHLCRIGNQGFVFFLGLMILPVINIFMGIYLFVEICRARNKTGWLTLLMVVPIINMLVWGYLAWNDKPGKGMGVFWGLLVISILAPVAAVMGLMYYTEVDPRRFEESLREYFEKTMESSLEWQQFLERKKRDLTEDQLLLRQETYYVWKDMQGHEHFVMSLDDVPEAFRDRAVALDSDKLGADFRLMSSQEEGNLLNQIQGQPVPTQLQLANFDINVYTYDGDPDLPATLDYLAKFNLPYTIRDVLESPANAVELKKKLGLDINRQYQLPLPILEINGQMVERMVLESDEAGRVRVTALNDRKIRNLLGLRETFE